VLGPAWTEAVAVAAAYVIAVVATPAGVSGAVLLLPFQVSVLGTPSPAVTPTNLGTGTGDQEATRAALAEFGELG
jgi:hypothetical protein